jgi:acetylornithine deacetylase
MTLHQWLAPSADEVRALEAIDEAAVVAELQGLVAIPSVSGSDAESDIQHVLAERLRAADLDVDLWALDLPRLQAHPDFPGCEVERSEAWGLVAGTGDGVPALALQAHVDVVPPGSLRAWPTDPFRAQVTAGSVRGRGTCDMKAGLVANLAAIRAVRAAGIRLERPAALHFVVGEEDGGLGAFATLDRGHLADACVITEPTSGTLVTANAGALTFELTVVGAATHASTAYAGESALRHFVPLLAAIEELERRRNRHADSLMGEYPVAYPISVGKVVAGDWASTVPDLLVAEGRVGVCLDEDPADARAALEEAVLEAATRVPWLRRHPPSIRWTGGQFASGRLVDGAPLLGLLEEAVGAVDPLRTLEPRGVPYGSDLRLYAHAGIPTLHYGPGDVRVAHSPHEQVPIDEIVTVARVLTLALIRACEGSTPRG